MNEFYRELKKKLTVSEGDVWIETVLSGENAGKKAILSEDAVQREAEDQEGRLFVERVGRIPRLVICGGGHVSAAVTKLGKMLGFYVTVLEDRPKFADYVRSAGADLVICASFQEGL